MNTNTGAKIEEDLQRKLSERTLQENQQHLRVALDSSPVGFTILRAARDESSRVVDFEWLYLNPVASRIIGRDAEELIGRRVRQVLPDGWEAPGLFETFVQVVTTGESQDIEVASRRNGIDRWFHNIAAKLDDGVAVWFTDVTERKLVEEQLRRSEAYLAESQRLSHTGSWAWNVLSGELFWSREHFRICGLDPEKWKPSYPKALQCIHPEDRSFVQEAFERSARERRNFDQECRIVRPNAVIRHIHSFAHPLFNKAGDLIEYVGTIIDITERKEEEGTRKELLRRLVLAQEDERRRVAREMHDQLGQRLSLMMLRLGMLKNSCGEQEALRAQIEAAEADARQLARDVDSLVWELRPTALDDLGLQAAFTQQAQNWSKHFRIPVDLHVSGLGDYRLKPEIETTLYRIAQEALNNIAKHARTTKVDIIFERRAEQVSLIIEDYGVGFDTNRAKSGGLGIIGMRERASLVGGSLGIESRLGNGVTVFVRIPTPPVTNGGKSND